jgi:ATPase subunit of ABC transporter with duplicated ATPase domains
MPERRKYDTEFREGAVTIVRETGKPIAEVAEARTSCASATGRSTAGPTSPALNFKGSDPQDLVGDLSGAERNRVHLAPLPKNGGNVLLLDEPTNDLDVDTLRAVEDALEALLAARRSSATTAGSSAGALLAG